MATIVHTHSGYKTVGVEARRLVTLDRELFRAPWGRGCRMVVLREAEIEKESEGVHEERAAVDVRGLGGCKRCGGALVGVYCTP